MSADPQQGEYGAWVVQLTRGQLLDLVLQIEERLRLLVRTVLKEAQTDWEQLVPRAIREDINRRASSVSGDLLDRASLAQLINTVLGRWKLFEPWLGDRQKFRVKADEFREWRNSLAHGKALSEDEKFEVALIVRQIGQQIPVIEPQPLGDNAFREGARVLWVDDRPQSTLNEREILWRLGIEVVPVLSNDEAVQAASERRFDLVISDIDRGSAEGGDLLPNRLRAVGVNIPIVFYVGSVDPLRAPPTGGSSITDTPAEVIRDALNRLSRGAELKEDG